MIYTLTLSPSLDYTLEAPDFKLGKTNRATKAAIVLGGKGINVSVALKRFGLKSTALGFVAGFTGEEILSRLGEEGIESNFIKVDGVSRINVKLFTCGMGQETEETELNGVAPRVTDDSVATLMQKLKNLKSGDALILAGSVPQGMKKKIYADMLNLIADRNVFTVVDTSGEPLRHALKQRPFLVKPNKAELSELLNKPVETVLEAVGGAKEAQKRGARNVMVSLGATGAVLAAEDGGVLFVEAPKGQAVNTVGAGDCMVAGFTAAIVNGGDYDAALKFAVAAGSACAFDTGLAERDESEKLYSELTVKKIVFEA